MGSFNVACSVSRITICPGMPVAYFPLKLYKYCYDPAAENNLLIYPWCYYEPVSLPIFGEYFDYGFIDSIEKNASTKALEKHYKCPIEVIVGAEGHSPLAGMFVHRDVYQCLVDNQIDEWGETKLVDDDDSYGLKSRKFYADKFNEIQKYLLKIRDVERQRKAAKKEDKWRFEATFESMQLQEVLNWFYFDTFETFGAIHKSIVQRGWMKDRFIDFVLFNHSLGYANVHYFPAANGYQFGNHYGNRIVHQKAVEILNQTIKEEKEK